MGVLWGWVRSLRVPVYAAYAGYFTVLALFPTLLLVLGLLRYTGLQVQTLLPLLEGIVPSALLPGAKKLILSTYQNTTGTLVSISAVTALWSASRGMHGMRIGLNIIYGVQESRGWLHTRLMSVVYTFAFLLLVLLTLLLHVFGTGLASVQPQAGGVLGLRFFLLLAVQTAVFTAMYTVLPNRRNRIFDSLPGALLASCGWLVFSDLFSLYVRHASDYASIFGSVYAVALSMLWLHSCICIVFYGGALNKYLTQ